ncbi:MAG: HEPN domain-containing protein [Syntrophobacteraceae bacterium]
MTQWSRDLVLYRLDRAHQTLEEAQMPADAGRWNVCVNRLYYACFYAVSALLAKDSLASSKHRGVRSLFNKHYVQRGKVPREVARIYSRLFERRQEGDYIDFVYFKETDVIPWISDAERFVEHITALAQNEST